MKTIILLFISCLSLHAGQTLTIGSVADAPSKEFKEFSPFMEYIKKNSAAFDEVKLKVFQSIPLSIRENLRDFKVFPDFHKLI